jgi:LacI family transcriptional regulator
MKDVARYAGVSHATVSNFLNNPELLSNSTREKIESAVLELGYVPSDAARRLRKSLNPTIGFIAFEISNSHFGAVADAVEKRAHNAGWKVMIGNALGSPQRELEYLELFESQRVGGLLIAPIGDIEDRLAGMRERGTRSIIVGRSSKNVDQPSISFDDEGGGYKAVKHLLEIGRRRIAFVGGPFEVPQIYDRFQGAVRAASEYSDSSLEFIALEERTVKSGLTAGEQILKRSSQLPDGIFAVNDLVAFGIMQALQARGLAIPDDVAVIGFDDFDLDASAAVPLSSISTPHDAIGEAAVDLVLGKEVSGDFISPAGSNQYVFSTELITRQSTQLK